MAKLSNQKAQLGRGRNFQMLEIGNILPLAPPSEGTDSLQTANQHIYVSSRYSLSILKNDGNQV